MVAVQVLALSLSLDNLTGTHPHRSRTHPQSPQSRKPCKHPMILLGTLELASVPVM
jgi:hypothetical protein